LQALKVLNNQSADCKTVYLRDKPSNKKLIVSSDLVKPNEKCYVCASKPEIIIKLNTDVFTIKQFETKVLDFFCDLNKKNFLFELNNLDIKTRINDDSARR
jgi:hypothetical protein